MPRSDGLFNVQWEPLEAMLELAASPFLGVSVRTIFLVLSAFLLSADCLKKPQEREQVFFDVHSTTPRCMSNAVSRGIPSPNPPERAPGNYSVLQGALMLGRGEICFLS